MSFITAIDTNCLYRAQPILLVGRKMGYLKFGTIYQAELKGDWYFIPLLSGYSHKSVVREVPNPAIPPSPAQPIYISQWSNEAKSRVNDCGPTCIAMFMRSRGDLTPIDQLKTVNKTGMTGAPELAHILALHGISSVLDQRSPTDEILPWSILLVNYEPIRYLSQDTRFTGWHWLIYVGLDPNDLSMVYVLDPNYWGLRIGEGNMKRLPMHALRLAFRPYGNSVTTTSIRVLDIPVNPPPVIAPIPSNKKGYGLHMLAGSAITGPYPIYKSVSDGGQLMEAHRLYRDADKIYRVWLPDSEQTFRLKEMREQGRDVAWNHWYQDYEGALNLMPYAYFESLNEVGAPDEYLAFEAYRIQKLAEMKRKACVLNIAAGQTTEDIWRRAKAAGMLDAAQKHGAMIGVHAYFEGVASANVDGFYWQKDGSWSGGSAYPIPAKVENPLSCHTGLRVLQDKKHLANLGYKNPWIVFTEMGADDMSSPDNGVFWPLGIQTRGWKDCKPVWSRMGWTNTVSPETFYKQQLQWVCDQTGCLGVVFTSGRQAEDRWPSFNVNGVL